MDKYKCKICGYVYNPEIGDPIFGIKEATPFEKLPAHWLCPVCSANSEEFEQIE